MEEIRLVTADETDAQALSLSQVATFEDDNKNKPLGVSMELPPGCDSQDWVRKMMADHTVLKILIQGRIAGGFILFSQGTNRREIGRVWIEPEFQSQGIGQKAFSELFRLYPLQTWLVETPDWATRNHHFYQKVGFIMIGETPFDRNCGWRGYRYRRVG